MIDLETKYLIIIRDILKKQVPDCEAWVFGSRINGRARKFSDLDLLLKGKTRLDWHTIERLKDTFSETDIPIIVDVVDAKALSDDMLQSIETESLF